MLTFYQKYYLHINLCLVVLLGLACGLLAGAWLDSSVAWTESSASQVVPQKLGDTIVVTATDLNLILQRNLFDPAGRKSSASVDLGGEQELAIDATSTGSRKSGAPDRTLLGTVTAGQDSLALMLTDGQFTIYRLGKKLPDGGTIDNIYRNYIQVREQDQSLTHVEVAEDDNKSDVVRPLATKASTSDSDEGIKQIDERHWIVSQRTAEEARQKLPAELRLAQMQPRITDGKTDGFIIRRLKRASILNKMGLQRGDVILNINDIALDGPESGLQVFQQLREARQISLAVERKGEAMTFSYELN